MRLTNKPTIALIWFLLAVTSIYQSLAEEAFQGVIGKTKEDSVPFWPQRASPPDGAPNVIVWLLDDAGYAHLEPYGGLVSTPTIEALSQRGLTYSDFHSVPLCSPARAALLTGRNHHSVAMGSHVMSPAGFPGYNGRIPKSAGSFAKIMQEAGYATYVIGKWDQTPPIEASVAGPFDSWPSRHGFDRFYGFMGADAHHFHPSLWTDHTPIAPYQNDPDYFLTTDMANKAIEFIGGLRANGAKKPFLLYWSTGAVHAPHHAPKAYIDKYSGKFDMGWDQAREIIFKRQLELGVIPSGTKLSPKLDVIPDWESLSGDEQRLYARQMEAFAGQLEHADHQFGRILALLERLGELDNTLIIVTSDNGASAEGGMAGLHNEMLSLNSQSVGFESSQRFFDDWGGPNTVNHFHTGWGMAGNTPFPYFKHHIDGGGTQVPMILVWPEKIKNSGVRRQYHHVIDIGPTILDLANLDAPRMIDGVEQKPLDGMSMAYTFENPNVESRRTLQYYEVWGNRGIYKDGWKAATIHNEIMPWNPPFPGELENDVWRLYHVKEDFSQSTDLADRYPEKLKELQIVWEAEAARYGVFPLDPDRRSRVRYQLNQVGRKETVIRYLPPGAVRIPEALSPPVKNKSHTITATLRTEKGETPNGVIVASGGVTGGYSLYVDNGYPVYAYNLYNEKIFKLRSDTPLSDGESVLEFRFEKNKENNGGWASMFLNDQPVGRVEIPEKTLILFSVEDGFDVGRDEGSPVVSDYHSPFVFSGQLDSVTFDLSQP